MKRNLISGFIVFLLIAGLFLMQRNDEDQASSRQSESTHAKQTAHTKSEPLQEGSAALDFSLETWTGDALQLYNNNGKPTLINFWASWCPPCKKEMPHIQEAYEQYHDDLNFFMINLTFNDNLEAMNRYIEENEFTFPVLLDKTGDVTKEYEVMAIPTTYIVDANNVITHKVTGPMTKGMLQSMLDEVK